MPQINVDRIDQAIWEAIWEEEKVKLVEDSFSGHGFEPRSKCTECGRELKAEKSRARGMGPVCAKKAKDLQVHPPMRPGKVLQLEFMEPVRISTYELAKRVGVAPGVIHEIVYGTRGITADIALPLAQFFGTSSEFWLNLQSEYDRQVTQ